MDSILEKFGRTSSATGLEGIILGLRKNASSELKIGWHDCDYLRGRGVQSLERAIRHCRSLTHISIGWRRQHQTIVWKILNSLAKSPARLQYLHLCLDDTLPDHSILTELLNAQHYLIDIHIRSVTLNTGGLVEHVFLDMYHCLPNWKKLSLVDCNLNDANVSLLADFLHIRGGLAELSLRSNRRITGASLRLICQAPVMTSLDISLCDLQPEDAIAVSSALKRRPWRLQTLLISGNYRLGSGAISLVNRHCVNKLESLDLSYSVSQDSILSAILSELSRNLTKHSTLRDISIHGAWNETAVQYLCGVLLRTDRLRSLQLNNPHAPKLLNIEQLELLEYALRDNYELEQLGLDYHNDTNIANHMQFWLRLNLAGRRIVRHKSPVEEWYHVMEKAGQDSLTILYWIVRNSAGRFATRERRLKIAETVN